MAWHPAVPGHQQIPTELKYSKRKENLQVHVIFRFSTAFGYIIHDRRKPTSNSAHLQNDDVTLSHSAMKTNSVPVTINIIRGLSGTNWGIRRHSDILKAAWHDIRYRTNYWNNEKYKYNNPDIYPATHVPQRAATEPKSARAGSIGPNPAQSRHVVANLLLTT